MYHNRGWIGRFKTYDTKAGHNIFAHSQSRKLSGPPGVASTSRSNTMPCLLWIMKMEVNLIQQINFFIIPINIGTSSQTIYLKDQKGIALVVTLLALVLITALVVEFSYGVYTGTNNLYNWRDSQRLSIMAKSGINVSARFLSDMLNNQTFSYPGSIELPVENPFEDFNGTVLVRIEDENSKFNINSLVPDNQSVNESNENSPYNSFKRLLKILSLDEKIADRIVDWIDKNSEARLSDSEVGAKNSALVSVDELLLINGINRKDYDKLLPYITVFGDRTLPLINVNGAEAPVIMSLSGSITEEDAKRIIKYRENTPFQKESDITKVAGFDGAKGQSLMNKITVRGENFYIKSTAASGGVKRIIETVLEISKSNTAIQYWKEY
jgi:general secretion pathway protein K